MPDGSARWIAKPSITNQATGICIFDRVAQLVDALHVNEDLREYVLQRCDSMLVHTNCLCMHVHDEKLGLCLMLYIDILWVVYPYSYCM